MFQRNAINQLHNWKNKQNRKPLVLRGARQVGKTTLVHMFSKEFNNYLYLNLEKKDEQKLFLSNLPINELIEAMFFIKQQMRNQGPTLIFIDEIQNSPEAVGYLRYFFEEAPDYYVISAGSLLETLIDKTISFPVGRVEYLMLHPCSFIEFLVASNELQSIEILNQEKIPEFAHDKLLSLFYKYTLLGGMPEIVNQYSENRDLVALNTIFESLLTSYIDDVDKYARNSNLSQIIQFVIKQAFNGAGQRIKFQNFGNSNYRSREIGEAFRILEKTMLLQLIYPITNTELPIIQDSKKSPRLQVLDTGLLIYFAGFQQQVLNIDFLQNVYQGLIAEHIVGQELKALNSMPLHRLNFWTRENKDSNSEVDYIYSYKNYLFPIEVKTAAKGRLRSLHEFVNRSPHYYAVRIYSGKFSIDKTETIAGKKFILLNLPYYLIHKIDRYLDMLMEHSV